AAAYEMKSRIVSYLDLLIEGNFTKYEAVAEGKSVTLNAVKGLKKLNRFKNLDPSLLLRMRFLTSSTISNNWELKLIALILAIIFWLYVK
ncbi:MAG: hypothetical protein ACK4JE_04910, partial [Endomicrobiia bacterium]